MMRQEKSPKYYNNTYGFMLQIIKNIKIKH